MLEWYRPGFSLEALMDETEALLSSIWEDGPAPAIRTSYRDLFLACYGVDPHTATTSELRRLAAHHVSTEHIDDHGDDGTRADYLDALFSAGVEPGLSALTFVVDYPACQSALACIEDGVARRFEVFVNGMELANGYDELTDPAVLSARFEQNNEMRDRRGLPKVAADPGLLGALTAMPDCAGIAVGLDRVLMNLTGARSLAEVIAFTSPRA